MPLYVTEKDLDNNSGLSSDKKKKLNDLNQRWLEINLGRTIAFKSEMNESEAKNYRKKVDELNKLFDGYIHTSEILGNDQFESDTLNKISPEEADRMKTALSLIKREFGSGLEYNKRTGEVLVGGIQLPSSVLKNINREVEQTVSKNTMKAIISGVWRKNNIFQINDSIRHTLDSDYKNLIVL
jgi:hypothetical protein